MEKDFERKGFTDESGARRVLGIDTGTNSLGWAIVDHDENGRHLVAKGVNIFQEGVKEEKGIESSRASERTQHKGIRVGYYRRKLRKLRLLRILSDNDFCPALTKDQLSEWRLKKVYPNSEAFMEWQLTDDKTGKNPYAYRHQCLHEKLDLEKRSDRYILGRALYHLNQRRGFLSNRKDQASDEDGAVKGGISTLSKDMKNAGCEYLGDYFFLLYGKGEKIRKHYTARNDHYLTEFRAICKMQELSADLTSSLEHAIFDQRPLKSQKGQVGHCVFEPKKTKCPVSHPLFEEYRMLCFVNNIKISIGQEPLRPLNDEERAKVLPLFFRKSDFTFERIAKELTPKKQPYGYIKEKPFLHYCYNYPMDFNIACCPVTAGLIDIFGDDWQTALCEVYTLSEGKTPLQIVNDVWHALYFYSDDAKLIDFAKSRLQLSDDEAKKFSKIDVPADYASLSLKAICKFLPYLRRGLIYSHAAFLANLGEVMPSYEWGNDDMREVAIDRTIDALNAYDPQLHIVPLEQYIKDFLKTTYNVTDSALSALYHPSMIETYPKQRLNEDNIYQLGSPRISSIRNPMAMRSMFRLRKLVNRLLKEGSIDEDTVVNIEFARELNDANKRKAIQAVNRDNEKQRDEARKQIVELYKKECGVTIVPTDTDVLKYILWEEQDHKCLYTGNSIGITDFIGPNPKYDIEHTVPRSVGGDSTRMNLTLCESKFNRDVKKTKLPSELGNHDEILARIEPWKKKWEDLDKQIRKIKTRGLPTKEAKDRQIEKRHRLTLQRDYWRGKYERFTMTEVPEGFSRRQGTDISVISRYARLYLKSVFKQVYTVKGIATSDFRKIWGLQEVYAKKERVNHVHHCIDAIVIACIGRAEYANLAAYYHDEENQRWYGASKASFEKPWPTFVEDVKKVENEILVFHHTPDNMHKQGNRRIRIGGKRVQAKGDASRGSLHKDTCYGAIEVDGEIKYVVRKSLSDMGPKDVANIVDDTVRGIVEKAIADRGFKEAMAGPIWMNEAKQIPIKKVRCYTPSVKKPLDIRHHRDVSRKEYKRQFHFVNDENYMLAIYVGHDKKGKEKRDFEMVNMLDAAEYYKTSNDTKNLYSIVPQKSKNGYPLAYELKKGTLVLLYEKSPEEIWKASTKELNRRLYKVIGYGLDEGSVRIRLLFHSEARPDGEVQQKDGEYKQGEELRMKIRMRHTQFKALVQHVDFELTETGEIKRLK